MMRPLRDILQSLADAWRAWDRFWFRPSGPETVSLLRVFAGGMVFYTHLIWGLGLDAFLGPNGFQDPLLVQAFHRESGAMSFWTYVPPEWIGVVHVTCLVILFCFWIGLATRLTSILAFAIVVSYANRLPLATFGLDQINCLLTMYLALAPCGDCYSVDRWLSRFWSALCAIDGRPRRWKLPLRAKPSATLAARLIQLNMCVIYLVAGFAKLKGETWWDGTAVWLGAANYEYQSGDLTWLAHYPWLVNVLTHATVFWEVTFCVFVWNRWLRPWVLAVGTAMHFGIGAFLGMWTFGMVMMITYFSFTPPQAVRALYARLFRRPERELSYDPARAMSRLGAALRCASSSARAIQLQPTAVPAPIAPEVVMRPLSPGEWWRQILSSPSDEWPMQPTLSDARLSPEKILIVAPNLKHQLETQSHFERRGCLCRVANDVAEACAALSFRSAECVVIYAYHAEELDDARRFRDLCMAAGAQAPTTVVAIRKDSLEDLEWEPKRDHRIVVFPFTLRELREEVQAAWLDRTGRGVGERSASPKTAEQPRPRVIPSRPRSAVH